MKYLKGQKGQKGLKIHNIYIHVMNHNKGMTSTLI